MGRRIGLINNKPKKEEIKKEEVKTNDIKLDGETVAKAITKKAK